MELERSTISILTIIGIGMIAVVSVLGVLVTSQTVQNGGTVVKTVGVTVYSDSQLQNSLTSISWGSLAPNSSATKIIYIKNNGTTAEILSKSEAGWNPSTAGTYITLSWNCTNYVLNHNAVVVALLTLNISPNIANITSFSFDMTIVGTENT